MQPGTPITTAEHGALPQQYGLGFAERSLPLTERSFGLAPSLPLTECSFFTAESSLPITECGFGPSGSLPLPGRGFGVAASLPLPDRGFGFGHERSLPLCDRGFGPASSLPLEPPLHAGGSGSGAGWSLWGRGTSAPSFYEQLQAAASDTFSGRGASGSGLHLAPPPLTPEAHPASAPHPILPHQLSPHLAAHLAAQLSPLQAACHPGMPPSLQPAPFIGGGSGACGFSPAPPAVDPDLDMAHLLAAVASIATLEP